MGQTCLDIQYYEQSMFSLVSYEENRRQSYYDVCCCTGDLSWIQTSSGHSARTNRSCLCVLRMAGAVCCVTQVSVLRLRLAQSDPVSTSRHRYLLALAAEEMSALFGQDRESLTREWGYPLKLKQPPASPDDPPPPCAHRREVGGQRRGHGGAWGQALQCAIAIVRYRPGSDLAKSFWYRLIRIFQPLSTGLTAAFRASFGLLRSEAGHAQGESIHHEGA